MHDRTPHSYGINRPNLAAILLIAWPLIAFAVPENVWQGTLSNSWSTAENWSLGHVPLLTENVRIETGAVLAEGEAKFAALALNGGSLRVCNALNGDQTVVASGATLTLASDHTTYLYGGVRNHGTLIWESGDIEGGNPAQWYACRITNEADGTMLITGNGRFGDWAVYENSGLLRHATGKGTASFARTFYNSGTISIEAGTLWAQYGILQSAGCISLAGGRLMTDNSTGLMVQGGDLSGSGQIEGFVKMERGRLLLGGNQGELLQITGSLILQRGVTTGFSTPSSTPANVPLVRVTGTLVLDGSLDLSFSDGSTPPYSRRYTLFLGFDRFGGVESKTLPPPAHGTYSPSIDYTSTSAELVLSAPPFANWKHEQFSDSTDQSVIGDCADPDGDGIANLLEYVFGLNPLVTSPRMPVFESIGVDPGDGGRHLTLTYSTRTAAHDVRLTVEKSTDLINWTSAEDDINLIDETIVNGLCTRIVQFEKPIADESHQFLRLRATIGL